MVYESSKSNIAKARAYLRKCQKDKNFDSGGVEWFMLPKEVRDAMGEIYLKEWTKIAGNGKVK